MDNVLSKLNFNRCGLVNLCVFLFPVFINLVKGVGDFLLLLLAIVGMMQLYKNGIPNQYLKPLRLFSLATVGYFLVLVLSVAFSGKPLELASFLSRDLHFLFAPFIFIAFLTIDINIDRFVLGVKFALTIMGLVVIFQFVDGNGRPSGVMNAGVFGNLAVMTLFFLVAYSLVCVKKITIFSIVSIMLGFAAVILSGTRGAMLSGLVMLVVCFALSICYFPIKNKKITIVFACLLGGIVAVGFLNPSASQRLTSAYDNLSLWVSGDKAVTSTGLRAEMYIASLRAVKDMPLMGYGYRNANKAIAKYASPALSKDVGAFNHLHNAYITNLLFSGFLGLASLLFLLVFPVRYFLVAIKSKEVKLYGALGLLLFVGYANFGLVNVLFGDVFMNAFYVFYLSLFYGLMLKNSIDA